MPGAAPDPPDSRPAVLYDADCGVCRTMLAALLAWDRGGMLRPVALQDPEAEELLAAVPAGTRMDSWHLVTPQGTVHSAGAGLPQILALLPAGTPLARLTAALPGPTEAAYRWVASHRRLLGRPIPGALVRAATRRIAERS